jgi:hypothetical protein
MCGLDKPLGRFGKSYYNGKSYHLNYCKDCHNERRKKSGRNEYDKKWREKNPVKTLALYARHRAKARNVPFTVSNDYLQSLWESQNNRCEVTGMEFDLSISKEFSKGPFRPSLDRIDSSLGYEEGNVRFVIWIINCVVNEYGLELFTKVAEATVQNQKKSSAGR